MERNLLKKSKGFSNPFPPLTCSHRPLPLHRSPPTPPVSSTPAGLLHPRPPSVSINPIINRHHPRVFLQFKVLKCGNGDCYDLLSKNCNHFCDEFCERLGVPKLPGWVNRFANAGDTAVEIAGNTAYRFRQAKTEIVTASRVAYQFLAGIASTTTTTDL